MNFENKKILILGYSVTGVSVAKFLTSLGAKCFITELEGEEGGCAVEISKLREAGIQIEFGGHSPEFINGSNLTITSPGIPPSAGIFKILDEKNIEYISDIELTHRFLTGKNSPKMVAITGTNGKTTTTMLLSHIMSSKFKAPFCGNIGISPSEFLNKKTDFLICEVSSFQSHYSPTFAPDIAIFTNLTPDHIYFHGSIEAYFEAKAKMFRNMNENQNAILNLDDPLTAALGKGLKCSTYYFSTEKKADAWVHNGALYFRDEKIIDVKNMQIVGVHNLQNALCSIIAAKICGLSNVEIENEIKTFVSPEHRLEFVCEFDDVKFYNDSKATNPEAAIVALKSFEGKSVVLIAGGRDKGTTLEEFSTTVKNTMKSAILIGEAADRFEEALLKVDFKEIIRAKTLVEAVKLAVEKKPDVVLLSPACASFDMFRSFEHRGEEFKKACNIEKTRI